MTTVLRSKCKSPYVVVHGSSLCITRGFDTLRKKAGIVKMRVETSFEILERPMKMVYVECYHPVEGGYEEFGDYWADVQTGTLYDPFDGKCLSSSYMRLILE